jgi:hypothetical protein
VGLPLKPITQSFGGRLAGLVLFSVNAWFLGLEINWNNTEATTDQKLDFLA